MRALKVLVLLAAAGWIVMSSGCNADLRDCRIQNQTQQKRIAELESELSATKLSLEQTKRQLETAEGLGGAEVSTLREKVAAMEKDLADKKALIASMQQQLIAGGVQLPPELNTMLEDFAKTSDMVTYDSERGIVKFKSDLLFKSGSAEVLPAAGEAIRNLCAIMNSEQGKQFDIIIAGHTDDQPIRYSHGQHPTNWHLSANRSIAVLDIMESGGVVSERMSVRGFGEYRPIVPNEPDKKGNAKNRRVEIYIVPKGV
jgi:chemotaxis protein MotB